jgi:high-affinity Fe2+/Pb2+ permease
MLGFLVSFLLGFGIFKVSKKINMLKKEKSIQE